MLKHKLYIYVHLVSIEIPFNIQVSNTNLGVILSHALAALLPENLIR